jgi:hypothetical protein
MRAGAVILLAAVFLFGARVMNFEFSSGATHHPEGFGAWSVKWDGRAFVITHQVREQKKQYPPATLSSQDERELLALLEQARQQELTDNGGRVVPDRVQASFTFTTGADSKTIRTWVDRNRQDDALAKLMRKIAQLIEKHTGVKPVLE